MDTLLLTSHPTLPIKARDSGSCALLEDKHSHVRSTPPVDASDNGKRTVTAQLIRPFSYFIEGEWCPNWAHILQDMALNIWCILSSVLQ